MHLRNPPQTGPGLQPMSSLSQGDFIHPYLKHRAVCNQGILLCFDNLACCRVGKCEGHVTKSLLLDLPYHDDATIRIVKQISPVSTISDWENPATDDSRLPSHCPCPSAWQVSQRRSQSPSLSWWRRSRGSCQRSWAALSPSRTDGQSRCFEPSRQYVLVLLPNLGWTTNL